jgi:hypothetical protein
MSRSVIINSILSFFALILVLLVVLQLGIFGESLKVSKWFGINNSGTSVLQDDYTACKTTGGAITVSVPRICQQNGKTYYESYAKADEQAYITSVENEAATLGQVLVSPLNASTMNRAQLDTIQKTPLPYSAIYSVKLENEIVTAKLLNKNSKGISTSDNEIWIKLISGSKPEEVSTILGSNTASVSSLDLSTRGIAVGKYVIDGESDKLLSPLQILVFGTIRDNYVQLSSTITSENLANYISDCVKSPEVQASQNKDTEAQSCFNKKITSDTVFMTAATAKAQKLAEIFSF